MKCGRDKWGLYDNVDFCITVPKDRCLEIMRAERDSIAYLGSIREMKWSGIELVIMMRKRLEVLYNYRADEEKDALKRFNKVIQNVMKDLRAEMLVKVGARSHPFPLFIEILRHTFWRPRDVLMYFTEIMSAYRYMNKIGMDFDTDIISKKISDTTFNVINIEFIGEFQSSLRNIEQVVRTFRGSKQFISAQELENRLAAIEFDFSDSLQTMDGEKDKARFLFEIGFIGLRCPLSIQNRFKLLLEDIFCFNDSVNLDRILEDESWKECSVIIHPIFCEYLNLDINQDIALRYSWSYLRKQELFEFSTSSL